MIGLLMLSALLIVGSLLLILSGAPKQGFVLSMAAIAIDVVIMVLQELKH